MESISMFTTEKKRFTAPFEKPPAENYLLGNSPLTAILWQSPNGELRAMF